MRVLFLARLFAGLKPSLAAGDWKPAGVPAIYHLLEGLAQDPDVELLTVFCLKERDPRFVKSWRKTLSGIGEAVLLPYRNPFGARRLDTALTELDSGARIISAAVRHRPDLIYATYATLLPAALLARAGHKVVLRFLGVVPHHREIASGRLPFFRWLLRSPFAHVVSSEDGSDPAAVLPMLLRPGTPWSVRLNGCDARLRAAAGKRANQRPTVLFLGRLEPYKGCLEFIDAALVALATRPDAADFVILGEGPLRSEMEVRVRAAGREARVQFLGLRPHAEVADRLATADIYVSTNMYGNLSNANLEAIAAGCCLVLPTSDASLPLDTVTDRLIPEEVACRYDRNDLPVSLAQALGALLNTPAEIATRRARTAILARGLIKPWAQSVAEDVALLKSIAASEKARAAAPQTI
jgi:glycosyltransferase involved in cell wall biosynthesis